MKKRAQKVILTASLLILAGLLYGLFFIATGIGIPCVFNKITGLLCPGCGVTHMCASLMKGDIPGAIHNNPMLFFMSPLLIYIIGNYVFQYIKLGQWKISRWQTNAAYVMAGLLVLFGILRNLK